MSCERFSFLSHNPQDYKLNLCNILRATHFFLSMQCTLFRKGLEQKLIANKKKKLAKLLNNLLHRKQDTRRNFTTLLKCYSNNFFIEQAITAVQMRNKMSQVTQKHWKEDPYKVRLDYLKQGSMNLRISIFFYECIFCGEKGCT